MRPPKVVKQPVVHAALLGCSLCTWQVGKLVT